MEETSSRRDRDDDDTGDNGQHVRALMATMTADPMRIALTTAAVVLVLAAVVIVWRWIRERRAANEVPPLLFGTRVPTAAEANLPVRRVSRLETVEGGLLQGGAADENAPVYTNGNGNGKRSVPVTNAESAASGGEAVEGTLQLLPGRLEPVNGDVAQEIRFVKTGGGNRYTIGRSEGPRHSHIQVDAPTASRLHAFMEYADGRWRIGNLSQTNCVVVNGVPLEGDAVHQLEPGDQIELGQLAFVFRDR